MYGLAKTAAEYSSREDDLIHHVDQSSQKRRELENSMDPELASAIFKTKLKHLGIGTGIGALGGGLIGGVVHNEPAGLAAGALLGAPLGLLGGAISGEIKGDTLFRQGDPKLYNDVQNAAAQEWAAHQALARHHELKHMYAPAPPVQRVELVQSNQRRY